MVELMHRREAVFTVLTPPEEVWRFIRDIESLCACIPGVERVRVVDDTTAELTVVEKVGVVTISVDFAASTQKARRTAFMPLRPLSMSMSRSTCVCAQSNEAPSSRDRSRLQGEVR
jgi:ligand-binding SRPBCC domain-containing protein